MENKTSIASLTKVDTNEIQTSMNYPWWVSSTGQGIAQRIISLVVLVIPILSVFGINIAQADVEAIVNAGLILIFAVWQVWAWTRAHFLKQQGLGKYRRA